MRRPPVLGTVNAPRAHRQTRSGGHLTPFTPTHCPTEPLDSEALIHSLPIPGSVARAVTGARSETVAASGARHGAMRTIRSTPQRAMNDKQQSHQQIAAEYTEFTLGTKTIALISDPDNPRAWLKSDVITTLER